MWDKNRPLKLADALCFDAHTLQRIIDVDKFAASRKFGVDLCGNYAPFCSVCDKQVSDPCSTAYRVNARIPLIESFFESTGADDASVIQAVADVDKYLASEGFGLDLCGRYAPFCAVCDKSQPFPCGTAYLKMKNAENFATKALVTQAGGELMANVPQLDDALTQVLESDAEDAENTADGKAAADKAAEDTSDVRIRIGIAKRRFE